MTSDPHLAAAWLAARPDYAPSRDELIAPAPEPPKALSPLARQVGETFARLIAENERLKEEIAAARQGLGLLLEENERLLKRMGGG